VISEVHIHYTCISSRVARGSPNSCQLDLYHVHRLGSNVRWFSNILVPGAAVHATAACSRHCLTRHTARSSLVTISPFLLSLIMC
jgi:hypothetical protein